MAFIPDNAFDQRLREKLLPILWEFYEYNCRRRNHETRLSSGTVEDFCAVYGYKRASKFALLKALKTCLWFGGTDGKYELLVGDFSPVNEKADARKAKREQSKKIDSPESQSKNLNSESKKIDESSKKLDSHIRNNQLSYQQPENSLSLGAGARTEIPIDEIFEPPPSDEPFEEKSPTAAIRIFREVFPNFQLGGQQMDDFAKMLPEVEESVWRQNLLDWRVSGWQASNIAGQIKRYKRELSEKRKEKTNGSNQNSGNNRSGNNGKPSGAKRKDSQLSDEEWYERNAHLVPQY